MAMSRDKILLVDDDPNMLRLLSIRLTAAGYEIFTTESGEEAIAQLAVNRPQLVITDLRMEGMDGMALFDHIHKKNPALPVIILTAHGSIPEAVAATQRGVFGFLTKPFNANELLERVAAALRLAGSAHQDSDATADTRWREKINTRSPAMEELLSQAKLAAQSEASIFIHGESGTGKELLARAIRAASPRRNQPFVALNCGAIPETLLESELFGHTKGSFTGAVENYAGHFQAANHGTLFLDEIGDMPLALQVKLLRVLQEKRVKPLGSTRSIPVDVRIISATHRNLAEEITAGTFREDLYYRLNVVALDIPNLSGRREDIPLLANHFLNELSAESNKAVKGFSPQAMEMLISAAWPGNVRQLRNVVEQAVVLSTSSLISAELVRKAIRDSSEEILPFADAKKQFEREYFIKLLKATNGNVSRAARLAERNRTEFYKLLQRYKLNPADFRSP